MRRTGRQCSILFAAAQGFRYHSSCDVDRSAACWHGNWPVGLGKCPFSSCPSRARCSRAICRLAHSCLAGLGKRALHFPGLPSRRGSGSCARIAMARFRWVEKAIYPLVVFIQTTPQISIAPLLIVWFGYGSMPKVLLAGMIAFFPVLVDSSTGFKSLDPRLLYVTRSMGAIPGRHCPRAIADCPSTDHIPVVGSPC